MPFEHAELEAFQIALVIPVSGPITVSTGLPVFRSLTMSAGSRLPLRSMPVVSDCSAA